MTDSHIISVLVENEFGVLARVASMFAARGYNIDSLSVSPTLDPKISHIILITHGSPQIIEQIAKQLNRLIDVIEVRDLTGGNFLSRETVLVKVVSSQASPQQIIEKIGNPAVKFVQQGQEIIFELTDESQKVQDFLKKVESYGVTDLVKTGTIAMPRTK